MIFRIRMGILATAWLSHKHRIYDTFTEQHETGMKAKPKKKVNEYGHGGQDFAPVIGRYFGLRGCFLWRPSHLGLVARCS
jgi:hypothetical protein